jgi:hypothetical protein
MVNCTPTNDAFVVTKLRQAGAVVLGKVCQPDILIQNHLNEFAFQGISRSSLGGQVRNPYDLTRTPGGSSGGTGASIAANFAMVGIGTDTLNSVFPKFSTDERSAVYRQLVISLDSARHEVSLVVAVLFLTRGRRIKLDRLREVLRM